VGRRLGSAPPCSWHWKQPARRPRACTRTPRAAGFSESRLLSRFDSSRFACAGLGQGRYPGAWRGRLIMVAGEPVAHCPVRLAIELRVPTHCAYTGFEDCGVKRRTPVTRQIVMQDTRGPALMLAVGRIHLPPKSLARLRPHNNCGQLNPTRKGHTVTGITISEKLPQEFPGLQMSCASAINANRCLVQVACNSLHCL